MKTTTPDVSLNERLEREVERELRLKDAREHTGSVNIRRSGGR
jgi:hypothetical protein